MSKLKRDIQSILHPRKIEDLHPPTAPKSIVSEKEEPKGKTAFYEAPHGITERPNVTDSNLAIDFSYLTNNSSFQRAIITIYLS